MNAPAPASQFAQHMEQVAGVLLGKPNPEHTRPGVNLRYGTRGSLSVDLVDGVWHDHEAGKGGGVLDLIEHELGKSGRAAVEWLERQGIHKPANENKPAATTPSKIVAEYDYVSANGELLFQVCRLEPKTFRQRRPNGNGWSWSVKGVAQVPYRLPQMIEAAGATVYIVEGEKDADKLASLGRVATCNAGGANKWQAALTPFFKGRRVVILPDNDEAGCAHAALVASRLKTVAQSVRIIDLKQHWPAMPDKGDVCDWLNAGNSIEELEALIDQPNAPAVQAAAVPAFNFGNVTDIHDLPAVDIMSWPHMSPKMQPLNTRPNLEHLLSNYGVSVRYDVIRKDLAIRFPGQFGTSDNLRETAVNEVMSLCALNRMPKADAPSYLLNIGDLKPVNPVMDFILSQPWDGVSRFHDLLATVQTRPGFDRDWMSVLMRRWLVSAVAAAAKPSGFFSKGVLVFQGPQSSGKTAWFRALLPEGMRDLLKVDAHIDPDNKDSIISAVSHWLVELGELDGTLRKADIARLKGFISQDVDQFRRPYARAEGKYGRRTVFFASVNPEEFLADDTGSVRWWTIPVTALDYSHSIEMQQLWAEVYGWFEAGEQWWLDPAEEICLEAGNSAHAQAEPVEELIQSRYGDASNVAFRSMTATDVLIEIGYDKPTRVHLNKAANALREMFGEPKRTKTGRFFNVPALRNHPPF